MGDKNKSGAALRAKAQQMRQEQERKDRRTRAIIIGVTVAVVLVVVAVVAVVISNQVRAREEAMNADPVATFGEYGDGRPIVYSHLGVGQTDPALPTLTEYFDYSCPGCASIDAAVGQMLSDLADQGKANIVYQPVSTHMEPIHFAATSAVLIVAQKDPQHFVAFHHAVLAYVNERGRAGDHSVMGDMAKSEKQVKEIATSVGVPADVVSSFPLGPASVNYLQASTTAWSQTQIADRQKLGTPEFIANNKMSIPVTGPDAKAWVSSVEEILATLGPEASASQSGAQSGDGAQSAGTSQSGQSGN